MIFFTLTDASRGHITGAISFVVVPFQEVAATFDNFVSNGFGGIFRDSGVLLEENEQLRQEIERLSINLARLELLDQDNVELSEALSLSQRYPNFDKVGARIIAWDSNNWNSSFIIDKGERDGIQQNMVVLAQGGLVGRVSSVGPRSARVTPIIDDNSAVGGTTLRTGDFGFVRGDLTFRNRNLVRADFPLDADVLEGDQVRTSGLGDIYPPGLIIGTVLEIYPATATGFTAVVEPIVDFTTLNTVLIIYQVFEVEEE